MRVRLAGSALLLIAFAAVLIAGGVQAPAAPRPTKEAVALGTGGAVASVDPDATRAHQDPARGG